MEVDNEPQRSRMFGSPGNEHLHRLVERTGEGPLYARELARLYSLVPARVLHHGRRILRGGWRDRPRGVLGDQRRRDKEENERRDYHGRETFELEWDEAHGMSWARGRKKIRLS